MRSFVAVVALGLAACSTPADLRGREPAQSLSSTRTVPDLVACIAARWESSGLAGQVPVTVKPLEGGGQSVAVVFPAGAPTVFVDLRPAAGGASASYYKQPNVEWLQFDPHVAACLLASGPAAQAGR